MLPIQLLIAALGGWLHREQADVIAFLREENRVPKAQLAGKRYVSTTTTAGASLSWDIAVGDECSGRSRRS